jgi:hypothetical protein
MTVKARVVVGGKFIARSMKFLPINNYPESRLKTIAGFSSGARID